MKLKEYLMLESIDLETAFDNPAILWLQGLTDKEADFFVNVINKYNKEHAKKVLKKKFKELTDAMFEEIEELYRKIIFTLFKKGEEFEIQKNGNFADLMFNIAYTDKKDELVRKMVDKIRD